MLGRPSPRDASGRVAEPGRRCHVPPRCRRGRPASATSRSGGWGLPACAAPRNRWERRVWRGAGRACSSGARPGKLPSPALALEVDQAPERAVTGRRTRTPGASALAPRVGAAAETAAHARGVGLPAAGQGHTGPLGAETRLWVQPVRRPSGAARGGARSRLPLGSPSASPSPSPPAAGVTAVFRRRVLLRPFSRRRRLVHRCRGHGPAHHSVCPRHCPRRYLSLCCAAASPCPRGLQGAGEHRAVCTVRCTVVYVVRVWLCGQV